MRWRVTSLTTGARSRGGGACTPAGSRIVPALKPFETLDELLHVFLDVLHPGKELFELGRPAARHDVADSVWLRAGRDLPVRGSPYRRRQTVRRAVSQQQLADLLA